MSGAPRGGAAGGRGPGDDGDNGEGGGHGHGHGQAREGHGRGVEDEEVPECDTKENTEEEGAAPFGGCFALKL